jgi:hypothetical protein
VGRNEAQPDMPVPEGHSHAWYEITLDDARVGMEREIPWVVCKFMNGPDNHGIVYPWYRAHCMN